MVRIVFRYDMWCRRGRANLRLNWEFSIEMFILLCRYHFGISSRAGILFPNVIYVVTFSCGYAAYPKTHQLFTLWNEYYLPVQGFALLGFFPCNNIFPIIDQCRCLFMSVVRPDYQTFFNFEHSYLIQKESMGPSIFEP